jgi:hypothetical protein
MQENASTLLAAHYFGIIWSVLSCLPIQVVIMITDKSTEKHSYVPWTMYIWMITNPVHRINTIKTTDTLSRYISHIAAGKTDTERPSRLPYVMLKKSRKWKSVASFNNWRLEQCISQCSRWQRQHHVWAVKYCGVWCCVRLFFFFFFFFRARQHVPRMHLSRWLIVQP